MAVSDRLSARLSKVPGVTSADIADWTAEAKTESGLAEGENDNALYYLALAIAYETIAGDAARYFSYTDGEESVNKTGIFANYMTLARNARKNYRKYRRGNGASQTFAKRADGR